MKIAFFTDTFFEVNGVATSISNFATELGRRGHHVVILCPAPKKKSLAFEKKKNVTVIPIASIPAMIYPDFRLSPFIGLPKVMKVLKEFKPDVVHFHTTVVMSFDAVLAAKIFGIPLVGTYHVYLTKNTHQYLDFVSTNRFVRGGIARAVLAYCIAFYNLCDVRIVPSKILADELKNDGYEKPFVYLPNPVPVFEKKTLTSSQKEAIKKKYSVKGQVILHVGRVSKEKCISDVLKAFAMVHTQRKDTSLLIVGDGADRKHLEALAKKLRVSDRVVITGLIPHEELLRSGIFNIADVFATASPMESQGMVIVEAMAFGIPVVAVAEAAVPEVVGEYGVLVPQGDTRGMANSILSILSKPELSKSLSKKSLARAEFFSLKKTTDHLVDLYKQAAVNRKKRKG